MDYLRKDLPIKKIVGDFDEDIKKAVFKAKNSYNFYKKIPIYTSFLIIHFLVNFLIILQKVLLTHSTLP
ncbi:hypothetical protein QIA36_04940 (plasmid) [Borreliella yangtzensis]